LKRPWIFSFPNRSMILKAICGSSKNSEILAKFQIWQDAWSSRSRRRKFVFVLFKRRRNKNVLGDKIELFVRTILASFFIVNRKKTQNYRRVRTSKKRTHRFFEIRTYEFLVSQTVLLYLEFALLLSRWQQQNTIVSFWKGVLELSWVQLAPKQRFRHEVLSTDVTYGVCSPPMRWISQNSWLAWQEWRKSTDYHISFANCAEKSFLQTHHFIVLPTQQSVRAGFVAFDRNGLENKMCAPVRSLWRR